MGRTRGKASILLEVEEEEEDATRRGLRNEAKPFSLSAVGSDRPAT